MEMSENIVWLFWHQWDWPFRTVKLKCSSKQGRTEMGTLTQMTCISKLIMPLIFLRQRQMDLSLAFSCLITCQAIRDKHQILSQHRRCQKIHMQPGGTTRMVWKCEQQILESIKCHKTFTSQATTQWCLDGSKAWKPLSVNVGFGNRTGWMHSVKGLQCFLKTLSCTILKKKSLVNNFFLGESGKLHALLLCECCFVLCYWLMSLANSAPSWFIATSTKTWRSMSSGSHCMVMHLKTSVSCLTSPREAFPGRNRMIASTDLSYPHIAIQCRPCILNGNMTHDLFTLLEEAPEMYLSEIQDWIALVYKVHISRTALHMNICDAEMTFKLLCKAAAEHDEDLQEEWKQDVNADFTASQMIFINDTSKDDWTIYWNYGHSITGSCVTIGANFVWGEQYSIVAALSLDGYKCHRRIQWWVRLRNCL